KTANTNFATGWRDVFQTNAPEKKVTGDLWSNGAPIFYIDVNATTKDGRYIIPSLYATAIIDYKGYVNFSTNTTLPAGYYDQSGNSFRVLTAGNSVII